MFQLVQGNILHGYIFAMKGRLEDFSLTAFTQFRDQFWFEVTLVVDKPSLET